MQSLVQRLEPDVRLNAPLASYSALGVGGPAEALVCAGDREALVRAVLAAREYGCSWRVFGGLTNVLLPDAGLSGVVILNQARAVQWNEAEWRIQADAGALLAPLAREAVRRGWDGLTWAVGLPGTLGGAAVNNAGAFGGALAQGIAVAEVLTAEGDVVQVGPEWFGFGYRTSCLKAARSGAVILSVTLQLQPGDAAAMQAQAAAYTERRRRTQPPGRSLGSTFKNPAGDHAGRLLEAAGLKGRRCGGFVIAEQHANFFIHEGDGSAADYQALISLAQTEVLQKFGVRLEPEIEILEGS